MLSFPEKQERPRTVSKRNESSVGALFAETSTFPQRSDALFTLTASSGAGNPGGGTTGRENYADGRVASTRLHRDGLRTSRVADPLATSDIDGAQPRKAKVLTRGIERPHVAGSTPRTLHRAPGKGHVDLSLKLDDIDGARPTPAIKSKRFVNPLEPDYGVLGTVHVRPVTPPKLLRPSNDLSDIDGARAKPTHVRSKIRNPCASDDIPGAKAVPKTARSVRTENMDVSDINGKGRFRTSRVTNPLDPTYEFAVDDAGGDDAEPRLVSFGSIAGSHPKRRTRAPVPSFSLRTDDVDGATPPADGGKRHAKRRHYRNTMYVGDILGAKANQDTRHAATIYKRHDDSKTPSDARERPLLRREPEKWWPEDEASMNPEYMGEKPRDMPERMRDMLPPRPSTAAPSTTRALDESVAAGGRSKVKKAGKRSLTPASQTGGIAQLASGGAAPTAAAAAVNVVPLQQDKSAQVTRPQTARSRTVSDSSYRPSTTRTVGKVEARARPQTASAGGSQTARASTTMRRLSAASVSTPSGNVVPVTRTQVRA